MRVLYSALEIMIMRDIPLARRLSSRHYEATYTSLRTGGVPGVMLDPENNTYETPRAKVTRTGGSRGDKTAEEDAPAQATKVLDYLNMLEDSLMFVLAIGYAT